MHASTKDTFEIKFYLTLKHLYNSWCIELKYKYIKPYLLHNGNLLPEQIVDISKGIAASVL